MSTVFRTSPSGMPASRNRRSISGRAYLLAVTAQS
jgi:hypothetical protein